MKTDPGMIIEWTVASYILLLRWIVLTSNSCNQATAAQQLSHLVSTGAAALQGIPFQKL